MYCCLTPNWGDKILLSCPHDVDIDRIVPTVRKCIVDGWAEGIQKEEPSFRVVGKSLVHSFKLKGYIWNTDDSLERLAKKQAFLLTLIDTMARDGWNLTLCPTLGVSGENREGTMFFRQELEPIDAEYSSISFRRADRLVMVNSSTANIHSHVKSAVISHYPKGIQAEENYDVCSRDKTCVEVKLKGFPFSGASSSTDDVGYARDLLCGVFKDMDSSGWKHYATLEHVSKNSIVVFRKIGL